MNTKKQARWVRFARWLHRKLAVALFIFFLLIAVSGMLLGVKKEVGLQEPTHRGVSADASGWLPLDSLLRIANRVLADSVDASLSTALDRIDVRPEKGIAKFSYLDHYWGLQLDCTSGKVLVIEKRTSDLIEDLHDGSFIDRWLGGGSEPFKIGYTLLMGGSLLLLILSGLWLWYGPKRIRKSKQQH